MLPHCHYCTPGDCSLPWIDSDFREYPRTCEESCGSVKEYEVKPDDGITWGEITRVATRRAERGSF